MTLRFWRRVWRIALTLRLWPVIDLKCRGVLPDWHGFTARYCCLPRWHRNPLCQGPDGSRFQSITIKESA